MLFAQLCFRLIVVSLGLYQASLASEPMCSKFHYEEQLLEKMVRVEHKMELMDKEVKNMGEHMEDFPKDILNLREKITNEMEKEKADLHLYKENLKIEIRNETEEKGIVPIIAFNVHNPVDKSLDTNQILVYNDVLLNEGEGYDKLTGMFTAPVAGLYQVAANVCCYNKKYMNYAIVVEDTNVAVSTEQEDHGSTCTSVITVAMVKTGERVWVKCLNSQDSQQIYEGPYRWNSFTGVLLHK